MRGVVLVLCVIVLGAIAMLSGVDARSTTTSATFQISAGETLPMQIADSRLSDIAVMGPCDLFRNSAEGVVFSTFTESALSSSTLRQTSNMVKLEIFARGENFFAALSAIDRAELLIQTDVISTETRVPGAPCFISVTIESDVLTAGVLGEETSQRLIPESLIPTANELNFRNTQETGSLSVSVGQVKQYDAALDVTRIVVFCIGLVSAVLAILIRAPFRLQPFPNRSLRITRGDFLGIGLLLATLLLLSAIKPPRFDDGWVLSRARLVATNWSPTASLVDPYNFAVPNIQGFWYESLLGLTVSHSHHLAIIRVLSSIAFLVTWILLVQVAIPQLATGAAKRKTWLVSVWLGMSAFVWAPTLRAEVQVSLFLSIALAIALLLPGTTLRATPAFFFALLGLLAIETHQSGLVVALFCILMLVRGIFRSRQPVEALYGALLGVGVGALLLFSNSSVMQKLDAISAYREIQSRYGALEPAFFSEATRIPRILSHPDVTLEIWSLAALGLLVLALIGNVSGRSQASSHSTWVVRSLLISPIALVFTSSKWEWHLAVLLIPAAVALYLVPTRHVVIWLAWTPFIALATNPIGSIPQRETVFVACAAVAVTWWVSRHQPRTSRPMPGRSHVKYWPGAVTILALATTFLIINPSTDSATSYRATATQGVAGLVDKAKACGAIEKAVNHPQDELDAVLVESSTSTVPPQLYLSFPCQSPPILNSGFWTPSKINIGEGLGTQDLQPGTLGPCLQGSRENACVSLRSVD